MINFFFQDNNFKYTKNAHNFFKNDMWVNGNVIENFEKNIEKKFNLKLKACSCNSGSDALLIALKLDHDKNKDIYLTTPISYIASSSIAKFLDLELIYIDVEQNSNLLDLAKLENFLKNCKKTIRKRIKGIINVELFGFTNNLVKLKKISKKYGLSLIGDCSQSLGTYYKGRSTLDYYDYSVVSYYPTKILSAYGDAGMVFVKKDLKNKALLLKNNGHSIKNKSDCKILGINSRMDSFQAYILNNKLKEFNKVLKIKKKYAEILKKNLPSIFTLPEIDQNVKSNNYILSFYVNQKSVKKFINHMQKNNIPCRIIYEKLLSENKVLRPIIKTKLTNASNCKKNLVSIPSHERLNLRQFMFIIKTIKKF